MMLPLLLLVLVLELLCVNAYAAVHADSIWKFTTNAENDKCSMKRQLVKH